MFFVLGTKMNIPEMVIDCLVCSFMIYGLTGEIMDGMDFSLIVTNRNSLGPFFSVNPLFSVKSKSYARSKRRPSNITFTVEPTRQMDFFLPMLFNMTMASKSHSHICDSSKIKRPFRVKFKRPLSVKFKCLLPTGHTYHDSSGPISNYRFG